MAELCFIHQDKLTPQEEQDLEKMWRDELKARASDRFDEDNDYGLGQRPG